MEGKAMSMWTALLVTGGTFEKRKAKAGELLGQKGSAPNLDFLILETQEDSLGIERIREIEHYLATKPLASPQKSVLISQAEKLTVVAQNALLKTLEEGTAVIALLCPDADLLLPTVVSRCQTIDLPVASEVNLTPQEHQELDRVLRWIEEGNYPAGFAWAKNVSSDRNLALAAIDKLTVAIAHPLLEGSIKPEVVRRLFQAKKYLQANTSVRLTLENLFLNW